MILVSGQVAFLMHKDYYDGGYPVVIIERDTWRKDCYIVRRRLNLVASLNHDEIEKYNDDLEFLILKYNEFDKMDL